MARLTLAPWRLRLWESDGSRNEQECVKIHLGQNTGVVYAAGS